jgi:hypothetical protein
MYPVARDVKRNTLNEHRKLRILVQNIPGPNGQPWFGLEHSSLELIWNVSSGQVILCRGKIDEQGRIIAKFRLTKRSDPLVLRIGPPRGGKAPPPGESSSPDEEFEWCEQYELDPDNDELPPIDKIEGAQARMDILGYQPGLIDGYLGPIAASALIHFQQENGLPVTGTLDNDTLTRLAQEAQKLDNLA